jgi:hypothetical protein
VTNAILWDRAKSVSNAERAKKGLPPKYAQGGAVARFSSGGSAFPSLASTLSPIFSQKEKEMKTENQYRGPMLQEQLKTAQLGTQSAQDAYNNTKTEALMSRFSGPGQIGYKGGGSKGRMAAGGLVPGYAQGGAVARSSSGGKVDKPRAWSVGFGMAAGGLVPGYADGGMIEDDVMLGLAGPQMGAVQSAGMGGMGGMGMDPLEAEYAEYVQGAEEMGLPPMPFEEYVQLAQQTPEGEDMMGGMGGGDPHVGGKMVIDPDPNAPTDSIPAMIDGEHPAALDSGEFVIPRHAVLFHGIDKLKKLIAQSEAAEAQM